ncbi:MAG: methylmalonyl-CoA mutase family protein, partial [Trebonia sp.]
GVANVADPLGGSWYVEALTDRIEAEAEAIFQKIKDLGKAAGGDGQSVTAGLLRGIDDGYFTGQIAEASFQYQRAVEKGEKRIVGVNAHTESIEAPLEILRVSHEVEVEQNRVLTERRAKRDEAAVHATLSALKDGAARDGVNLIPPMLEAARVEATLGEICGVLKDVYGTYTEPARF